MSILGMTAARVAREIAADGSTAHRVDGQRQFGPALRDAGAASEHRREDPLTQLIRYTPAETVGAYILALSFLPPIPDKNEPRLPLWQYDFTWRWLVFLVFSVALTPLAITATQAVRYRAARRSFQMPWFEIIVGGIAFAAWGLALPVAPLFSWQKWDQRAGAIIAVIVLLVLGALAKLTGKALVYTDD